MIPAPDRDQASAAPPILRRAGPLLARYDVVFCDVWGVLLDGHHAFRSADEALVRFRARNGTVVLVSNAPAPNGQVVSMLDFVGVRRRAWDAVLTSGDMVLMHVAAEGYRRLYRLGPLDRDSALFDELTVEFVDLDDAEAVLCTGFDDACAETPETYRPALEQALRRDLPLICANPDLVVDVGGVLYPCAGAIAQLYEDLGGRVFWAGKPHESAFATAHALAERIRGETVARARVLTIGDAMRTDIAGAQNAGVDALLVASGIHRDDLVVNGVVSPERVARLFAPPASPAVGVMLALAW